MYSMDVMDDLFTPAGSSNEMDFADGFDDYDAYDDYDPYDDYDAYDDYDPYDDYDAYDDYDPYDDYGDMDLMDAMEEIVADALDAEDTDEFFRRIAQGLGRLGRGVVNVARQAAPHIGRIARGVGSVASLIPHPAAQAVGGIASVLGQLRADDADEFEAIDALADFADYDEDLDAAAPVIAGLTIRRTMPGAANLPRPQRRQLVRTVARSTRALATRQGGQAARAMPGIVRQARRTAQRTGQPVTRTIARTTAQAARRPQVTRQMARPVAMAARRRPTAATAATRRPPRQFRLRGPVEITIRGR